MLVRWTWGNRVREGAREGFFSLHPPSPISLCQTQTLWEMQPSTVRGRKERKRGFWTAITSRDTCKPWTLEECSDNNRGRHESCYTRLEKDPQEVTCFVLWWLSGGHFQRTFKWFWGFWVFRGGLQWREDVTDLAGEVMWLWDLCYKWAACEHDTLWVLLAGCEMAAGGFARWLNDGTAWLQWLPRDAITESCPVFSSWHHGNRALNTYTGIENYQMHSDWFVRCLAQKQQCYSKGCSQRKKGKLLSPMNLYLALL